MARAIVIFEDDKDEGGFSVKITFEPGLERGQRLTMAQQCGLALAGELGEEVEDVLESDPE
ncbi:hypothetical protein [Desulfofustis glycolicus]|jgi:hypothetical protein|uniref:Uncharacterized protein n=1 Tax=Desulfofustis glycolicus DSM 9705 TaxID=1121409 RepID=A0A1M5S5Y3_9BACT|nr:hypothetical protein [Desulfofustis glycolicus]SHH33914.1 hypothetical protein SAMN02745124_00179 [Desulfofustis glycolicus DSM 9705]